jgi:hypothetical protein
MNNCKEFNTEEIHLGIHTCTEFELLTVTLSSRRFQALQADARIVPGLGHYSFLLNPLIRSAIRHHAAALRVQNVGTQSEYYQVLVSPGGSEKSQEIFQYPRRESKQKNCEYKCKRCNATSNARTSEYDTSSLVCCFRLI